MQAIISADSAMSQVQNQGSVVTKMEGRAGVLESEIKLDSARGGNVEAKQEELAEIQQKTVQVQSAQMNTLAQVSKEMETAQKVDQKTDKTDTVSNENTDENGNSTEETAVMDTEMITETDAYLHVDVRL